MAHCRQRGFDGAARRVRRRYAGLFPERRPCDHSVRYRNLTDLEEVRPMKIQALQVGLHRHQLLSSLAMRLPIRCAVVDPGGEPEAGSLPRLEKLGCAVEQHPARPTATTTTPAAWRHCAEALPARGDAISHDADFDFPSAQLLPLKAELARIPFGGVNFYEEGDRLTVGGAGTSGAPHPRPLPGRRDAAGAGTPCFAGTPCLPGLHAAAPISPAAAMEEMMDSLKRLAAAARGLPGAARPYGRHAPWSGSGGTNPYVQMALRPCRNG